MLKKEITKPVKRKRIFGLIAVILLLITAYPIYHTYQYVRSDRKLRSYIKHTTIPAISNRMFGDSRIVSNVLLADSDSLILDQLALQIADSTWDLLKNDLEKKLTTEHIIQKNTNPWRIANIQYNGEDIPCKIKLRGDTRDNYQYGLENATFRINIIGDKTIKNCKKFSLIRPFHENGLYGMIYYNYARKSGILSNEFDFVELNLRNNKSGIWIFQEAFHMAMLDNQKAGKGLILKFENDCNEGSNVYNASGFPKIIAYGMRAIRRDSSRHHQFQRAVRNLLALSEGSKKLLDVLDLAVWAKFVAINDLFYGHHSMTCHNMRLYFNPESDRIEPVAWDPFCYRFLPYGHTHEYFADQKAGVSPIYTMLQEDVDFVRLYKLALKKLIDDSGLDAYLSDYVRLNRIIGPLLHRPIVTPGFDLQVIAETRKRLNRQFYITHPLLVNAYKYENEIEIINTSLLPIYCEKCILKDTTLVIDKVIYDRHVLSYDLIDTASVNCLYRNNLKDSLVLEEAEVYRKKDD